MTKDFQQTEWSLIDLLPDAAEETIAGRLTELEAAVVEFELRREELATGLSPNRLLSALHDYQAIQEKMMVLGAYGSLWFASDTQSEEALTFRNRMEQVLTEVQNRILFFSLWWKELNDDAAERLLPSKQSHPDEHHYLGDLRRLRPYILDERSEQIINMKDANGIGAVLTLYSMLTNRLEFRLEIDGEEKVLTRDGVMSFAFSPDPNQRAAAYREVQAVFQRESKILSQIYINRVRDWYSEQIEARRFASPIAVRHLGNDVPAGSVDALLDVTREHVDLFQRYFRLKAGWLGLDRLRRYDIYAPLAAADRRIPYTEGVGLVLETFDEFHPRVGAEARKVFSEGHIDSAVRPGKKGGAFCATVLPSQTPWLLVNYNERVRDVSTLAHELGHAVHSQLANHHSILTQHSSLPLAETASVFAEMLLTERLLGQEEDPVTRRELLAAAVDDIYGTVVRQAYFTRFEIAAHEAVVAGRTPDELAEVYFSTLTEQFGDAVEVDPEFRYEWVSIPHIYQSPFYCYAYSFGQLLVLALYRRYQQEGAAFIPGYLKLLAYGGSERPEAILSEMGIDITEPEFWRGGFAVVSDMVDEMEKL
jgi:oligoendopeptidase F